MGVQCFMLQNIFDSVNIGRFWIQNTASRCEMAVWIAQHFWNGSLFICNFSKSSTLYDHCETLRQPHSVPTCCWLVLCSSLTSALPTSFSRIVLSQQWCQINVYLQNLKTTVYPKYSILNSKLSYFYQPWHKISSLVLEQLLIDIVCRACCDILLICIVFFMFFSSKW